MAPSDKTLEADLKKVVRQMFKDDEDLTVNSARERVAKQHSLEEGFFTNGDWKNRSKNIIKELAGKLADGDDSEQEAVSNVDKAMSKSKTKKRGSPSADPPAAKRQKKAVPVKVKPTPKKKAPAKKKKAVSESELSDLSESEPDASMSEPEASISEDESEEEAPKPKKGAKKAAKSSESELSDLESSEEEKPKKKAAAKPTPRTKPKAAPKSKSKVVASDSELSEPEEENAEEDGANDNVKDSIESKAGDKESAPKPVDDINSDSELSSVIDEPPPKKRGKSGAAKSGPAQASTAKEPKQLSADEEEIKKLQGQLVKCGIRKIWGIELKQYGDDAKAKIRHLRGMLADVGMTGRFSEARAKEIKEQRELMADLEAVNDMNALWGSRASGGRASRSKAPKKSLKEDTDSDDEEGGEDKSGGHDEDADEEEAQAKARVSRRMADLAFLDDESDSD